MNSPTPEFLGRIINSQKVHDWFDAGGQPLWNSQKLMLASLQAANWGAYQRGERAGYQQGHEVVLSNLGRRSGKTVLAHALMETHETAALVIQHAVARDRFTLHASKSVQDRVFTEREFEAAHAQFKLALYDWDFLWQGRPESLVADFRRGETCTIKSRTNTGDLLVWLT